MQSSSRWSRAWRLDEGKRLPQAGPQPPGRQRIVRVEVAVIEADGARSPAHVAAATPEARVRRRLAVHIRVQDDIVSKHSHRRTEEPAVPRVVEDDAPNAVHALDHAA